jgi:transcriptional regulator with XRE-family HTH domain
MTGQQLRAIRHALGLRACEMAAALGDQGNAKTRSEGQRRLEGGAKAITLAKARLAWFYARYGVPEEWILK